VNAMAVDPKGRVDILVLRLADELGNRLHAETTIDLRHEMKLAAEHLIEDLGLPRTPITPNSVVRSLLGIPDRAATPGPRKQRIRRVK
jgi:hypothetical protein